MSSLSRRNLTASLAAVVLIRPALGAAATAFEIWKVRACGCCAAWARHFELAGLGGCHTGKVAGYVVEGHLPVMALQRFLAERPAVLGLAVPGMPLGSPGMESEGEPGEPYDVIAFTPDGSRPVFMAVRP